MYTIRLTLVAADSLKKLDATTQRQVIHKIESLKQELLLLGKPLKGPLKEYRSIRAAGQREAAGQRYRIIYKVIESEIIVVVVSIGIRKDGDKKDIYALMKKYIKTGLLEQDADHDDDADHKGQRFDEVMEKIQPREVEEWDQLER